MKHQRLTVAEITQLLQQDIVHESVLTSLQQDSRVSVGRLLQRWQQRQAALEVERMRVARLYEYERKLRDKGYQLVAGVDEAGRGPLAGPVVIGAVILPPDYHLHHLNDSKKLSAKQRMQLYDEIKRVAIASMHIVIAADEIDELNIYQATVKGMYAAVAALQPEPSAVLIDAVALRLPVYSQSLIGGDSLSASIAAASIVAKVERDLMMDEMEALYPGYGFAKHKGYGTAEHLAALKRLGPCRIHRRSFAPVRNWEDL